MVERMKPAKQPIILGRFLIPKAITGQPLAVTAVHIFCGFKGWPSGERSQTGRPFPLHQKEVIYQRRCTMNTAAPINISQGYKEEAWFDASLELS
jgi:hypothetical protein